MNFNDEISRNIDSMFIAVEAAMTNMMLLLRNFETAEQADIITSYNQEREINNMRNQLRVANVENINNHHYEYQAGIYYMDIIGSLEKIGDYIINVVDEVRASSARSPPEQDTHAIQMPSLKKYPVNYFTLTDDLLPQEEG